MKNKQTWLNIVLIALVCILAYTGCGNLDKLNKTTALYEATQDTLTTSRNKLGQEVAKVGLLVGNSEKDLLKLETQDKTIQALQKTVKKYKGKLAAATVAHVSTADNGSTVTTITNIDTLIVNGDTTISPVYETEWDEEWSKGNIKATKDNITRNIFVKNKFEITQGYERQGLFKKKKAVVTIKNLNPNTVTQEMRSFVVEEEKKRIAIGLGATYGVNLFTFKPGLVVGVTGTWTILRF